MENIEKYRQQIDKLDRQIAKILEERFEIVTKIGNYKRENNLPIQDLKRDSIIINNALSILENDKYKDDIAKVFNSIILSSKSIQY